MGSVYPAKEDAIEAMRNLSEANGMYFGATMGVSRFFDSEYPIP